ncbi:Oidioi.mRNA.OKI2018_I69.chr2.g4526.t1.cds [Oikopleura dioica]|uniref:Oidioi.mRNA.OKI2018_I69.chr2.g4526.t1.cds n=1 Tax=Oikopleura dioica TaxID=34765 RepID=A0ABN7T6P9_OIKDI|nr:Oidioi.mRNA.OKI2018_I69.chr2.g4526.t1.cds [Oikopleura dioica]
MVISVVIGVSLNLGCFFFNIDDSSYERLSKDFFTDDSKLTEDYSLIDPNFQNFSMSFYDAAVKSLLMLPNTVDFKNATSIFDLKYKKYEVYESTERFRCCVDLQEMNEIIKRYDKELESFFVPNCTGDELKVFISIKTTPLIWQLLGDIKFYDKEIMSFYSIFNDIHLAPRNTLPENCPASFLLCNTSFIDDFFEKEKNFLSNHYSNQ